MVDLLNQPLKLPCGTVLSNRIAKAAMSEGLADSNNYPTQGHANLYRRWSRGGAGLLITGNVMVDRRYLEHPGNVAIEDASAMRELTNWAKAGTQGGNEFWVQLSHPGRQTPRSISWRPVAPSAVRLKAFGRSTGWPRALKSQEIEDIVVRFAVAAAVAREAGFTGVQIDAAHGYLISEFLSPLVNLRQDEWGGVLENRALFLLEIVRAVRVTVGHDFPIAVKINAADFQTGGLSEEECHRVAQMLSDEGIDFLEISGGTYESPVMLTGADANTGKSMGINEGYFLKSAPNVRRDLAIPLMVTGGFRTRAAMLAALEDGAADMVGVSRPFCVAPDFPRSLLPDALDHVPPVETIVNLGPGILGGQSQIKFVRQLNSFAVVAWCWLQMHRLSDNLEPDWHLSLWTALSTYRDMESQMARTWIRPRAK